MKSIPTVLAEAPTKVKSVVPMLEMLYVVPIEKEPAVIKILPCIEPNPEATLLDPVFLVLAVPVPEPTPVAMKSSPTVLAVAPIRVKLVVPIVVMLYVVPIEKEPAVIRTLPCIAPLPVATLLAPVVLEYRERYPEATLLIPVVLEKRD